MSTSAADDLVVNVHSLTVRPVNYTRCLIIEANITMQSLLHEFSRPGTPAVLPSCASPCFLSGLPSIELSIIEIIRNAFHTLLMTHEFIIIYASQ